MRLSDIADVWMDEVIWSGDANWRKPGPSEPKKPLKEGDIIVTRIGGTVSRYHPDRLIQSREPVAGVGDMPRNFIVVRLKPEFEDRYDHGFILAHLEQKMKNSPNRLLRGSLQQATSVGRIKQMRVSGTTPIAEQRKWAEMRTAMLEQRKMEERLHVLRKARMDAKMRSLPDLRTSADSSKSATRRIDGEEYIKVSGGKRHNRKAGMAMAEQIRRNHLKSRILTSPKGDWTLYAGDFRKRRYSAETTPKHRRSPLGSEGDLRLFRGTRISRSG